MFINCNITDSNVEVKTSINLCRYCGLNLLVESLIRVMYWVAAAILNLPYKPLNMKFCIIFFQISVH